MLFLIPFLALAATTSAVVIPRSSIVPAPLPSATPRPTYTWTGDSKPTGLAKRCDNSNESCQTISGAPASPIAVTTTMITTTSVECTTTTTVIDSTTLTTTYWSTEVVTQTVSIEGDSTITVQIITPAPIIMSSTFLQDETLTIVTNHAATSFWTSSGVAQTVTSTGGTMFKTLSLGGSSASASAPCSTGMSSTAPDIASTPVQTSPAWTATSASISSGLFGGAGSGPGSSLSSSLAIATFSSLPSGGSSPSTTAIGHSSGGVATFSTLPSGASGSGITSTVSGVVSIGITQTVKASGSSVVSTVHAGVTTTPSAFSAGEKNVKSKRALVISVVVVVFGLLL